MKLILLMSLCFQDACCVCSCCFAFILDTIQDYCENKMLDMFSSPLF